MNENLIERARQILFDYALTEQDTATILVDNGACAEFAFLAVKAAVMAGPIPERD